MKSHLMKRFGLLFPLLFSFCFLSAQNTTQAAEDALIGEHMFGVQFIWDGYGTAEITRNDTGELTIKAEQFSSSKEEYVLLNGKIELIDDRNFIITGHLKLFTEGCCGLLDRDISYTFRKTGNRTYWRLKERNDLCDQYTCAYYMDIFE